MSLKEETLIQLVIPGFEKEFNLRPKKSKETRFVSTKEIKLFRKFMIELHDIKEMLSSSKIEWLHVIGDYYRSNKRLTKRQFVVVKNIHSNFF